MQTFNELKKNLKNITHEMHEVKLAILADSATQFLVQAIRGTGVVRDFNVEVFEADFNQIDRQILDRGSELYNFNPGIIVIYESTHKLLQKFNKTEPLNRRVFSQKIADHIDLLITTILKRTKARIIYCNFCEEDDRVFGQYSSKVNESFIYQLRKLNVYLQEYAEKIHNVFICDLSTIQNTMGRDQFWSPNIYVNSEMLISIDALPYVASAIIDIIAAFHGKFKKCLIVDLDNTLWGGIIGDDGIENIQIGQLGIGKAFTEFQYWIKKLQQRGIILAVCSKNTESVAKEAFEKHPDMTLRMSDISVFAVNWENKADNIRRIQKVLNIGFDSMVFLDDNPFERQIVRENIPGIEVPELPEDPAMYLDFLYGLNLFETISYSKEDANRTLQYQKEAERLAAQESFTNEEEFLKSLQMVSITKPFDAFTIPRIAQLSQRSNQFNLRTVRYTEEDLKRIAASDDYLTLSFTLEDKFGDNGLICAIIMKKMAERKLFIDTWFMSCRVLKRGMENYVLNSMVELAKKKGYFTIVGEYLPTAKNSLVRHHYPQLGFELQENLWKLDIHTYQNKINYINKKLEWTEAV